MAEFKVTFSKSWDIEADTIAEAFSKVKIGCNDPDFWTDWELSAVMDERWAEEHMPLGEFMETEFHHKGDLNGRSGAK